MEPVSLRVHAIERRSRANGPGTRFAIWVQGCTLGCPGCFNPTTHQGAGGEPWPIAQLVDDIVAQGDAISGLTVSGGEPLQQPEALLALVQAVRARTALSVVVFSGYSRREIGELPLGEDILQSIDVLIDGRYQARDRLARGLRGSTNQTIHLFTARYQLRDIEQTPVAEVVVGKDGTVRISGVDPLGASKLGARRHGSGR